MLKYSFILCDPIESFDGPTEFERVLRQLKTLGLAGVEFNLTPSVVADCERLLAVVNRVQLPVVSFLTGANYFGRALCLSSSNEARREQAVNELCQFTAVAARFRALMVVGQMQGFRTDEPNVAVAEQRIEDSMRRVAAAAEENGTTVVVEPVNHLQCGFHNDLSSVMSLTQRIGSENLKPMLDTFHMNIEESSLIAPIQRAGGELRHFHLCESNGGRLGSGHINVDAVLAALESINYQGYVSIKVYREPWEPAARPAMEYLMAKGFQEGT